MNKRTIFDALAQGAAYTAKTLATTYRVDSVAKDGTATPVGDTHDTFDAGYDDYVESHKYWPHDALIVWEIAADGSCEDITARMIYEAEMICERRGIEMEWAA